MTATTTSPFDILAAWWGDDPQSYAVVWAKGPQGKRSAAFCAPRRAEQAAQWALEQDRQGVDAYFQLCPQAQRPAEGKRGEAATAAAMPGLWLDVDIAGPGHKAGKLCPSVEEALALVGRFPLPPMAVVHSGGGLHCYWAFARPFLLATAADRAQADRLSRRFQGFFRGAEVNHEGFKIDGTADLARVLRVPGTRNHKTQPPRHVRVLTFDPANRHDLEAFARFLPAETIQPKENAPSARRVGRRKQLLRAQAYMATVEGVGEGERNTRAFQVAADLRVGFQLGEEGLPLFEAWNSHNTPPLEPEELKSCWDHGKDHATKEPGHLLNTPPPARSRKPLLRARPPKNPRPRRYPRPFLFLNRAWWPWGSNLTPATGTSWARMWRPPRQESPLRPGSETNFWTACSGMQALSTPPAWT